MTQTFLDPEMKIIESFQNDDTNYMENLTEKRCGNCFCDDYKSSMFDILNDPDKFAQLDKDPLIETLNREKYVRKLLKSLN